MAGDKRVDDLLISEGRFTQKEMDLHREIIEDTYLYKKKELEFALKDAYFNIINTVKKSFRKTR